MPHPGLPERRRSDGVADGTGRGAGWYCGACCLLTGLRWRETCLPVSGWLPSASLRFSGTRRSLGCRWSPACTRCSSRWRVRRSRFLTSPRRLRGLRHRGPARRDPGRARGPARWRAAAGAARVRGEFPVPHRPGRVSHRRRYPGSRRQLPDMLGVSATGQNTLARLPGTARAPAREPDRPSGVSRVIVVVLAARLVNRRIPGLMIVVIAAIIVSRAADLAGRGVAVLGAATTPPARRSMHSGSPDALAARPAEPKRAGNLQCHRSRLASGGSARSRR